MEKSEELRERNIQKNKQRIISKMEADIKSGEWKNLKYHARQFNSIIAILYVFSFVIYGLIWIIFFVFLKWGPLFGFYSTIIPIMIIGAGWFMIIIEQNNYFFVGVIEEYISEHQYWNDCSCNVDETIKTLEKYNSYGYILSNNQKVIIMHNVVKYLLYAPGVLLVSIAGVWIVYYLITILSNPINAIIILLLIIIFMLLRKGKKI